MKALPLLGHAKRIAGISIIAIAALGASSCISPSEKEFKEQHGFKRSDFFGKKNSRFVPKAARDHSYLSGEESTSGFSTK